MVKAISERGRALEGVAFLDEFVGKHFLSGRYISSPIMVKYGATVLSI